MNFFYKYKIIIFLTLFLLFSIFLGFILYSVFFSQAKTPSANNSPSSSGTLPNAKDGSGQIVSSGTGGDLPFTPEPDILAPSRDDIAKGGVTKTTSLNNSPGSNFSSSQDGNSIQYYDKFDGKFYKLDSEGNLQALSEKVFYNVENVSWANSKNKAVIEYPDGANIVYDFVKEKQITLPKHWEDFEFSPNDKQLVVKSIGLDPENRWLAISGSDGSNTKYIEPLGNNADNVYSSWSPNNQSVALLTEGIDLDRQSLYFIGQNKENFKSTIIEGRGFEPLWAPDGKKLLYSVYSNNSDLKPSLWIVRAQGEEIGSDRQNLGLSTWASKCNFSGTKDIYCAVPQNIEKGAGLFPNLGDSTTDSIYKIDIQTGISKLIAIPDESFTISDIVVSENQKTLFFVDKKTEIVHKIDI